MPVVLLLIELGNVALAKLMALGVPKFGVVITQEVVKQTLPDPLVPLVRLDAAIWVPESAGVKSTRAVDPPDALERKTPTIRVVMGTLADEVWPESLQ